MGLSASQGRMLLLTARKDDLEFRAQQISQKRLLLSQQLEEVATDYEEATSNRQMTISLYDTSASSDAEKQRITKNLTYNMLMSGTWSLGDKTNAGVQQGKNQYTGSLVSNVNYRLVDTEGAIVIASLSEIPESATTTTTKTASESDKGFYHTYTENVSGGSEPEITDEVYHVYAREGKNASNDKFPDGVTAEKSSTIPTSLSAYLGSNASLSTVGNTSIQLDKANGIVIVNANGETSYFSAKSGQKYDLTNYTPSADDLVDATIDKENEYVVTTNNTTFRNKELQPSGDGKYHVTIGGKEMIYVLDTSLSSGTTDATGNTAGPNYLQDCIRNGKYSLQQGKKNEESNKFEWRNVSWDSSSNIYDKYYSEDDDAAKAKYDRLQTQIQAQDKKLELELDNIETQRSAVTTEVESIEKVIKDNVDKTFKTFA